MGMYDNIKCEYPLPGEYSFLQDDEFQTKDFNNLLDSYTITTEGKLIWHQVRYEDVPEKERPLYGTEDWDKPWGKILGCIRPVPVQDIDLLFHGDMTFHTITPDQNRYISFKARFTNGALEYIKLDQEEILPTRNTT